MPAPSSFRSALLWLALPFAVGSSPTLAEPLPAPTGAVPAAWKIGTPIVTYWAGPGYPGGPAATDASCTQLVAGGWNLAWAGERDLPVLQRHGLRALLTDPLLTPDSLTDPAKRDALDALVRRVRTNPSMFCYHLVDEASAATFPQWAGVVTFLRERDPAHAAYLNLLPTYANNEQLGTPGDTITAYREHLRQFTASIKPALLSYDHYHFTRSGDGGDYFLNLGLIRAHAAATGVPFMNIVQASNWVPGALASPSSPRVPDGEEMRFLVYTTLAYGAQGISYYVYCWPAHEGGIANPDGTPTPLYHALKPLNHEFTAIATQLQPLASLGAFHSGMMPRGTQALPADAAIRPDPMPAEIPYQPGARVEGVLTGLFGPSGKSAAAATHALVVNLDYRKERLVTVLGTGPLEVLDATTRVWTAAGGNRIELRLPGGGGRLVRLANPSIP